MPIFHVQEGVSWVVKCLFLSLHWKAGGARSLHSLKRIWRLGHVQSGATKVIKGPREEGKSKLLGLQKGMCVARVVEDGRES